MGRRPNCVLVLGNPIPSAAVRLQEGNRERQHAKRRAEYYRGKAAEARAEADGMSDFEAKKIMMQTAQMWGAMAASAERHSNPN